MGLGMSLGFEGIVEGGLKVFEGYLRGLLSRR